MELLHLTVEDEMVLAEHLVREASGEAAEWVDLVPDARIPGLWAGRVGEEEYFVDLANDFVERTSFEAWPPRGRAS